MNKEFSHLMGYGPEIKNRFISLLLQGLDVKTIQRDHFPDITPQTLNRWSRLAKREGHLVPKKSPGRPPKLDARDERHLKRVAKTNSNLSIKRIGQAAGLQVHHQTLVKYLKRHNLQSFPMLKKPKLTDLQIRKRFEWATRIRDMTLEDWKKWTFSDECSVSLDCSEGIKRVVIERKDRHLAANCIGRKQQGGGKLMIWSFIFWDGRGPVLFLRGGIDQDLYKEILLQHVLPHCEEMLDENGEPQMFMDDGASSHDAEAVIEYAASLGIQRPYWPPNSPDMNPMSKFGAG